MILRIILELGEPDYFLGINRFAFNYRAYLAVASARIKADAATVEMTSNGGCGLLGCGSLIEGDVDDLKGCLVNARHKLAVESADAALGVIRLNFVCNNLGARDDDLITAANPKKCLNYSLNKVVIFLVMTGAVLKNVNGENRGKAIVSFKCDGELFSSLGFYCCFKIAVNNRHRHKAGIKGC